MNAISLQKHKAVAIILSCVVVVVFVVFGAALLSKSISENKITNQYIRDIESFWIAEAGIQKTLLSFNSGDWSEWTTVDTDTKTLSQNFSTGSYSLTVTNFTSSSPQVTVQGDSSGASHGIDTILAYATEPYFTHAAFGKTALSMSGNGETDSYDSEVGGYGGGNLAAEGDVGTNGISAGSVSLSGNAKVNGDAATGPGGTVTTNGNAVVTGATYSNMDKDLPSVDVPDSLEALLDNGNYSLGANNNTTWPAGDYYYSSINIDGNATLTLEGNTRIYLDSTTNALSVSGNGELVVAAGANIEIYVDGRCTISGNGITNQASLPQNFLLYSTYDGTGNGVLISGNGDLYAAVYAPDSQVQVTGNGDIYGALVGDSVHIPGNGNVHYDDTLGRLDIGSSHYAIQSWLEQSPIYSLQ
jgi:hypothetical protein